MFRRVAPGVQGWSLCLFFARGSLVIEILRGRGLPFDWWPLTRSLWPVVGNRFRSFLRSISDGWGMEPSFHSVSVKKCSFPVHFESHSNQRPEDSLSAIHRPQVRFTGFFYLPSFPAGRTMAASVSFFVVVVVVAGLLHPRLCFFIFPPPIYDQKKKEKELKK